MTHSFSSGCRSREGGLHALSSFLRMTSAENECFIHSLVGVEKDAVSPHIGEHDFSDLRDNPPVPYSGATLP